MLYVYRTLSKRKIQQETAETEASTSASDLELNETDIDASELSALISNDVQYHSNELLDSNMCESNGALKSVSYTESEKDSSDDLNEKQNGDVIAYENIATDTKCGNLESSLEVTADECPSQGSSYNSENEHEEEPIAERSQRKGVEKDCSRKNRKDTRTCMGRLSWDQIKSGQCVKSSAKNHCLYLKYVAVASYI